MFESFFLHQKPKVLIFFSKNTAQLTHMRCEKFALKWKSFNFRSVLNMKTNHISNVVFTFRESTKLQDEWLSATI